MFSKSFVGALLATIAAASPARRSDYTSKNWCGQVLTGTGFTEIDATWTVPRSNPTATNKAHQPGYNYQWVGIDGAPSGCEVILQAGTYARLKNNTTTYGFWYEFYPSGSWLLDSPAVSPGDTVYVKVQATSSTAGSAYMENRTTGKNTTIQLQAPAGSQLCQKNVEWIQENSGGDPTTFAPFDTFSFSFSNCHATDGKGNNYNLNGSTTYNMQPAGSSQLCHPSNVTAKSVTINYG